MNRQDAARLTAGDTTWSTHAIEPDVPALSLADGPMGVASRRVDERDVSVLTPAPVALGASWDRDLVRRVGALVGNDAIEHSVDGLCAPNVNLARSPLAGRAFEYYSEDPCLAGTLGAAWVTGLQSTGTGAVPKHLVCNDSETMRDTVDISVSERALREVYLLPFEYCVDAGCGAIMAAYNKVNGDWCCEASQILHIVKDEWQWPGAVMSDFFATHSTEATINSGLDLEMPGPARFLGAKLLESVDQGGVTQARVDDAATRVARFARRFGKQKTPVTLDRAETLREAAAAGFTLLQNRDAFLPLDPDKRGTMAVIGPNAVHPCFQGGTFAKIALRADAATPLESIQARFGGNWDVRFAPGADTQHRLPLMPTRPGDGSEDQRGMLLEYFADQDIDAAPLMYEVRDTNSLVWFHGPNDQGVFNKPAAIRSTGTFTAEKAGTHIVYLGGTGALALSIDGEQMFRCDEKPAASDVMGMLKRGDAEGVEVTLEAGQTIAIEIVLRYDGGRVQGLWYGIRAPGSPEKLREEAVALAKSADIVLLMVGETADASVESKDREHTRLDADQLSLVEQVMRANPATAIIVNVGHAFDANFAAEAPALLVTWYPGEEYGPALADVLAGDREPGGRLPVTLARNEADYPALSLTPKPDGTLVYDDDVFIGYRHFVARDIAPLHPLGAGQGYADIVLTDARVEGDRIIAVLENRAARAGSSVVQLYREDAERSLIGYAKAELAAGETQAIAIAVEAKMLRRWDDGWQQARGNIPVRVSLNAADAGIALTLSL